MAYTGILRKQGLQAVSNVFFQYKVSGLHAVCWIFTMQMIDNILNNSGKDSFISFSGDVLEGIYI
jgi:hypothetical protein